MPNAFQFPEGLTVHLRDGMRIRVPSSVDFAYRFTKDEGGIEIVGFPQSRISIEAISHVTINRFPYPIPWTKWQTLVVTFPNGKKQALKEVTYTQFSPQGRWVWVSIRNGEDLAFPYAGSMVLPESLVPQKAPIATGAVDAVPERAIGRSVSAGPLRGTPGRPGRKAGRTRKPS